jgi:PPM family protein phosphatase
MLALLKKLFGARPRPLAFSGRTDTGRRRSHNEDSFAALGNRKIFIVADGMGGHNAGEVASRLAIESLLEYLCEERLREARGKDDALRALLLAGFHHANQTVMADAASDAGRRGMGCTLVACLLDGNRLHICHVGDARCYLCQGRSLRQVTRDHTALTCLHNGSEPGEQKRVRHVVTRAMGFPFPEEPEYHRETLRPGARALLCSDGLWNMVDDTRIEQILLGAANPEEACDRLVQAANEEGGRDNITALALFY